MKNLRRGLDRYVSISSIIVFLTSGQLGRPTGRKPGSFAIAPLSVRIPISSVACTVSSAAHRPAIADLHQAGLRHQRRGLLCGS
jgi:hypothetical protein